MPTSAALLLVMGASGVIGAQVGSGVAASFTSATSTTTGSLSFAELTASFATGTDELGGAGGVGGASYVMTVTALPLASVTRRYTSLTNTGSVTASLSGSITATGLTGGMTVAVDSCSQAWSAGVCGGTTTALLAATAVTSAPTVGYGSLAVDAAAYLRYSFVSTATLSTGTVTATAAPTGTGTGNRTAG